VLGLLNYGYPSWVTGTTAIAVVEDNGPPTGDGRLVDRVGVTPFLSSMTPITTCPSSMATGVALQQEGLYGDFVVSDAKSLPTTKDQCKNGGWRSYNVFKNQGDCVSFVATKGKNPPATTSG
jgi:hypothetical protein